MCLLVVKITLHRALTQGFEKKMSIKYSGSVVCVGIIRKAIFMLK
jgi:hypothetical protein